MITAAIYHIGESDSPFSEALLKALTSPDDAVRRMVINCLDDDWLVTDIVLEVLEKVLESEEDAASRGAIELLFRDANSEE